MSDVVPVQEKLVMVANDAKPEAKGCAKPCAECPFSRAVEPGGTGGADPRTYVGQALGPFWLPCHMASNWKPGVPSPTDMQTVPQCAGAAIFRTHSGVAERMPAFLHRLPANTELVFANPTELIAHHLRVPLPVAAAMLKQTPPDVLLRVEMAKVGLKPKDG